MKIGLIADSHDNLPMMRAAVKAFREAGIGALLHAGDIIAPFAARELLTAGCPVFAVYGNNDGEREGLAKVLENIQPGPRRFELGGKTFLLAHDRACVKESDLTGVDVFVFGHAHEYHFEPGSPFVINPGESGGWLSGTPTVALLDTRTMQLQKIQLA